MLFQLRLLPVSRSAPPNQGGTNYKSLHWTRGVQGPGNSIIPVRASQAGAPLRRPGGASRRPVEPDSRPDISKTGKFCLLTKNHQATIHIRIRLFGCCADKRTFCSWRLEVATLRSFSIAVHFSRGRRFARHVERSTNGSKRRTNCRCHV